VANLDLAALIYTILSENTDFNKGTIGFWKMLPVSGQYGGYLIFF
jgi:hypothetical protein